MANCPDSSAKKAKKQAWTPKAVDVLLKYIKEYKAKCEFSGVDFEADLSGMYTEVRRCLAVDFHTILGLNPATILGKNSKIWTAKSTSPTEKGREGLRFPLFCWQR